MSEELPRCDKCENCFFAKSKKHEGHTHYCKITGNDVGQSHFGMNSPRSCPIRLENREDRAEHE